MVSLNNNDNSNRCAKSNTYAMSNTYATNKPVSKPIQQEPSPYSTNSRAYAFVNIASQIHCCWCYASDSIDARCGGACYCCCPTSIKEKQCNICPNTFSEYWYSGYVQTHYGYDSQESNGLCCIVCFPSKFALFFPCMLGSLCNNSMNYLCGTDLNYLF